MDRNTCKKMKGRAVLCLLLVFAAVLSTGSVWADEISGAESMASESESSMDIGDAVSPEIEHALPAQVRAEAADVSAPASAESNSVMSEQEKERALEQMGPNQGDVWVWSADNTAEGETRGPNGGPGQFNGGSVVMGGRPSYDPPAPWYYLAYKGEGMSDEEAQARFDSERGKWMDEFDPWGVVLEMADNTASTAWADVRNMQAFVLREGSTVWEKIVDDPQAVQWVSQFKGNMSSYVEEANQAPLADGGTSMEVLPKQDRVAHWGSDQARNIPAPQSIRAVLVSVEARLSERSDPDAKLGIQVGGDWKFTNTEAIHPFWYPGAGLSGIQRLSQEWERYYFVSVRGIQDAMDERAISREAFLASTVPLADMGKADPEAEQADLMRYQIGQAVTPTEDREEVQAASSRSVLRQDGTEHHQAVRQLPATGSRESSVFLLLGSAVLVIAAWGMLRHKKTA